MGFSTKQIAKLCTTHLRNYCKNSGINIKSTDAHELVAASFGYNTRAAMLADEKYPISNLSKAKTILLIASEPVNERRKALKGLPANLQHGSTRLAVEIYEHLAYKNIIVAQKAWSRLDIKRQALMLAHEYQGRDPWNVFYLPPQQEDIKIKIMDNGILITIIPIHSLIKSSDFKKDPSLKYKNFSQSLLTTIWLKRIAGQVGFAEPEINTRSIPMISKKQS